MSLNRKLNMDEFKDASAEELVHLAGVCESAERYEDMTQAMKRFVEISDTLNVEQRNLLSVAYKNVIGAGRAAFRALEAAVAEASDSAKSAVQGFKDKIQGEVVAACTEILGLLRDKLIPGAASGEVETNVFYQKMAGDYYRYLAEIDPSNAEYKTNADKYYKQATTAASDEATGLPATHPIRLGLALNYSVCNYEILDQKNVACDMAKRAFDAAISKLDQLDESSYKDSTLIMQLLRDNLTLWTSDPEEQA